MKIGIIGIGMLGEAITLNLLNLGYDVAVYNRTIEKTIEVEKKGATVMESPKSLADKSELLITLQGYTGGPHNGASHYPYPSKLDL